MQSLNYLKLALLIVLKNWSIITQEGQQQFLHHPAALNISI